MISLANSGPYLGRAELLLGSFQEIGLYCLQFLLLLGLVLFLKKRTAGRLSAASAILLILLPIGYVYLTSRKSEFLFSFVFAALAPLLFRVLNLFPMQALDYAFLFSVLLFPGRLFNYTTSLFGTLWIFWLLFAAIYITAKLALHRLSGNHFACYFLFVILSLFLHSYYLACDILPELLPGELGYYVFRLSGVVCITGALLITLLSLIRFRFHGQLIRLNRLGNTYRQLEKYFPRLTFLILMLFTLMILPFSFLQLQNLLILLLLPCMCLLLLWAQMPFLVLLFRAAFYKDSATFHEWEKEGLASYYQDLSGSLQSMQEMRHDMKNIFFTMGNFVNRSDDAEMKTFFWEKIYPYSVEAMSQNELLSRLYQIPSESLRAFFYLKLSQALNQKLSVKLELNLIPEEFQIDMDIIDLTRILGILLDNAIEEAVKLPEGILEVKLIGTDAGCSYIIRNSITEQTRAQGVQAGITSKGAGRGNGLRIVRNLLSQYRNVTLNSSLQTQMYIQSLNVERT